MKLWLSIVLYRARSDAVHRSGIIKQDPHPVHCSWGMCPTYCAIPPICHVFFPSRPHLAKTQLASSGCSRVQYTIGSDCWFVRHSAIFHIPDNVNASPWISSESVLLCTFLSPKPLFFVHYGILLLFSQGPLNLRISYLFPVLFHLLSYNAS